MAPVLVAANGCAAWNLLNPAVDGTAEDAVGSGPQETLPS
jgi:hypothetical protein